MFFVYVYNGADFLQAALFPVQGNLDMDEMTFSPLEENAAICQCSCVEIISSWNI